MTLPGRNAIGMAAAVLLITGITPPWARAQSLPDIQEELAQIRQATTLQAGGDLAGAERVLRGMMARNPTSLTGLLLLEQLLQGQGRLAELLPVVNQLIQLDSTSIIGHQVRVRTYAALGRPDDVERAGAAWIAANPLIETPYREIALLWLQGHDVGRALHVLKEGRQRIGTPAALALETGDAYLWSGDLRAAVQEWDRAIGPTGQGFLAVQSRLRALPDGGSAAAPLLVAALRRSPGSPYRLRAALQLAIDSGLGREAEAIAPEVLGRLPGEEREAFLADVARRADAAGLVAAGYWAYSELIRTAERGSEQLLALRTRQAQLALAAGDTAGAAGAYRQLEAASAAGSPVRRQAIAVRIQLSAREGAPDSAAGELRAFRTEYPQAVELDETAAAVAGALLRAGEPDAAAKATAGVVGPRSAVARGRLRLRLGDVSGATEEFMLAARGLEGQEATRVIALAAALTRVTQQGAELLGNAVAIMPDDPAAAIGQLLEQAQSLPPPEQAAVLDFAAAQADDAGLEDLAEQARRRLLAAAPASPGAPAALYWLAGRASSRPEQRDQATVLLERLIVEYPRSALVPRARRELERISGRGSAPDRGGAGGQ